MRYSRCMYRRLLNAMTAAELVSMDYVLQSSSSLHAKGVTNGQGEGGRISKGGESSCQRSPTFFPNSATRRPRSFHPHTLKPPCGRISRYPLQTYRLSHVPTHRFACFLFVLKKSCVFRFLTTMMDCFLKGGFQRVLVALMLLLTYSCAAGRRAIFRAGI